MTAFFSIIKNTYFYTVRSFIFQTLLIILIICSIGLPLLLTGDGTPLSHIKVTIDYSIWIISFILISSSLWLSCSIMNYDFDNYQMHMVAVKPVRMSIVWLGKFTGLLLIHLILLLISFMVFYLVLSFDLKSSKYSQESIIEINEKILTGREQIFPNLEKIGILFEEKWNKKKEELTRKGEILSKEELNKLKGTTYYQTLTQEGEVESKKTKLFEFQNLNNISTTNIILKFRIYVGDINIIERQNKPTASCFWEIKNPETEKFDLIPNSQKSFVSNIFYELKLPSGYTDKNGNVTVRCSNESGTSVFFQLNESPLLLVKKTTFLNNYFRAFVVIALCLIFILGLGCSIGSIFSFPIAVFAVISYLLIGAISNFILVTDSSGHSLSENSSFGGKLSNSILHVIVPLQKFQSSENLSTGQLIANNQIWKIIFDFILLKEFPLIFICIYIYSKRELGLIIKK
jgi:hypothetical protein